MTINCFVVALLVALSTGSAIASPDAKKLDSPEAASRTYAQNYKDMLLARCIARAYHSDPHVLDDASSTASVILEWTYYDAENSPDAIDQLIRRYLSRNYHNPLHEYKAVQFDLLKCFDMYHSQELAAQVKRYVTKPNHTYRRDNPPAKP